jgi:hypothetical protein
VPSQLQRKRAATDSTQPNWRPPTPTTTTAPPHAAGRAHQQNPLLLPSSITSACVAAPAPPPLSVSGGVRTVAADPVIPVPCHSRHCTYSAFSPVTRSVVVPNGRTAYRYHEPRIRWHPSSSESGPYRPAASRDVCRRRRRHFRTLVQVLEDDDTTDDSLKPKPNTSSRV